MTEQDIKMVELPLISEEEVKIKYKSAYEKWGKEYKSRAEIEHALQKKFRYDTMSKFTKALKEYRMMEHGDKIAVAISGGKDSLLLAKLFQGLKKFSEVPFEVEFFCMDPGYLSANRELMEFNLSWLGIPAKIFNSDIFEVSGLIAGEKPCYMCARMRRGFLYDRAKSLGCNKVALGHHFNDVIETTLLNVLWSANYKNMMPKVVSRNFDGMELIRPLFLVREEAIIKWRDYSGLIALNCACTVTQSEEDSQRKQIKKLIQDMKKFNPNVDISIFRSGENVAIDAILGYINHGEKHSFLETYGEDKWNL